MIATTNDNLVRSEDACPTCGERDADQLVRLDPEDDLVRCSACGTEYDPLQQTKGGNDDAA